MSTPKIKQRISDIIETLTDGLYEREEVIAVSFLAALAGQNSFLLGPPGTAKSLISRRISCAFKDPSYFECLMNRFSTPEEVFGPISIKALKEDKYTRKIEKYLADADFAFLDEIWKSSPAILNTLLTLINERIFRNGDETHKVPLKALISASNETPPSGQGLEAIYDRFLVRLLVPTMQEKSNFETLLKRKPTNPNIKLDEKLVINTNEWSGWQANTHEVELSEETLLIIGLIRKKLEAINEEHPVYISDRRWQRAAMFMKAAAFFCGRMTTNHSDALLLRHCLWSEEDNRDVVVGIVEDAVRESGLKHSINLATLDQEKGDLDKEINKELFHSKDVHETVKLKDRKEYFKVYQNSAGRSRRLEHQTFYIHKSHFRKKDEFHPCDRNGNELAGLTCQFSGQGTCSVKERDSYYGRTEELPAFTPKVLFHKGDRKEDVNHRLIQALADSAMEMQSKLKSSLKEIDLVKAEYLSEIHSPFVPEAVTQITVRGVDHQCKELKMRIQDCDRLLALCGNIEKPVTTKRKQQQLATSEA